MSTSNGYLDLSLGGRLVAVICEEKIDIEIRDEDAKHYYRIRSINPTQAAKLAAQLTACAEELCPKIRTNCNPGIEERRQMEG